MREMKQVEQEYSGLVMKAGQLGYQIEVLSQDLSLVHDQMKALNFEAAGINAAAKEAKDKAAAAVTKEVSSEPASPALEGLSS